MKANITKERMKEFKSWLFTNLRIHGVAKTAGALINTESYGYSVKVEGGKVYKFNDNYTRMN